MTRRLLALLLLLATSVWGQAQNSSANTYEEGTIWGAGTELPDVTRISFQGWSSPGTPNVLLTLNQPVDPASLHRHLFFLVDGLEKLPVTVEPSKKNPGYEQLQWQVQPVEEMPLDVQVKLKVRPGLLSLRGLDPSGNQETIAEFYTFPTPRFLGVECFNNSGLVIRIYASPSYSPSQGCNPLSRISLVFSSPVAPEVLRHHLAIEEFGASPKHSPLLAGGWEQVLGLSRNLVRNLVRGPRKEEEEYRIALPQVLKAATSYRLSASASKILDEFGRPLISDIDFSFPTNNLPPSLVIDQPISILERQVKAHLPVTVTNIGELDVKFQRLTPKGIERSQVTVAVEPRSFSDSLTLPLPVAKPSNVSYRFPLEVREWLEGKSGVVLGHLSTYPFTGLPRWFFSQVTPFHVHLKLGQENSRVWVTDLVTGKPVKAAKVRIYRDHVSALTARPTPLSEGMTQADGIASLVGTNLLEPERIDLHSWSSLEDPDDSGELLFVRVDQGREMALLPLSKEFSVHAQGTDDNSMLPVEQSSRLLRSWGTTAQGIYRTGDTIHFKIYVRDDKDRSLTAAPAKEYRLRVIDPMDRVIHQVKGIELNEFGAYHGQFQVSHKDAVGWYRFELRANFVPDRAWTPMRVLVGPSFEATPYARTSASKDSFGPPNKIKLRRSRLEQGRVLGGAGHHLPIEPEKKEYQVGETARILIRNPFPGGRALLSIERSGVQRSWSRVLKHEVELVEFEITPGDFPGIYFSATVMSPRSDQPVGSSEIRTSKPTVRMGYTALTVRDPHKEIAVQVRPRQRAYRPGATVTIDLETAPLHGVNRQEGLPDMELAVVVLDEAVFHRLAEGNRDFDPYTGFYHLQPLELQNFNILTPVIGMRSSKKQEALTADTGLRPDLASMFPFAAYWNPSLRTNARGRASFEFEAPHHLTAWRVLVMAVTSGEQMGFGEGSFNVHPAAELLPILEEGKEQEELASPPPI